jgi:hypothetical protein
MLKAVICWVLQRIIVINNKCSHNKTYWAIIKGESTPYSKIQCAMKDIWGVEI